MGFPKLVTICLSTQLMLKHSISYLSRENTYKTPPDVTMFDLTFQIHAVFYLTRNIVEGEIILTTEHALFL